MISLFVILKAKILNKKTLKAILKLLALAIVLLLATYLALNYRAIYKNLTYNEANNRATYEQRAQEMVTVEDKIEIPVMGIVGKISYPATANEENKLLEESIIHIRGTKLPGEGGNSAFSGHSSYIKPGYYGTIFSTLDRLVNGDEIYVYVKGQKYSYIVVEKKIIDPNDSEVLKDKGHETLTLLTCWPVGTTLKRTVVIADLLD